MHYWLPTEEETALPPEPPVERFERICDTRYVRIDQTVDRCAYGLVISGNDATQEMIVQWWNPVFNRVQRDVFCMFDVHPLGELRDALNFTDSQGIERRGLAVCVDGDIAVLECWRPGAAVPFFERIPMVQVQPFDRLLSGA
jgi:hypothetical protein